MGPEPRRSKARETLDWRIGHSSPAPSATYLKIKYLRAHEITGTPPRSRLARHIGATTPKRRPDYNAESRLTAEPREKNYGESMTWPRAGITRSCRQVLEIAGRGHRPMTARNWRIIRRQPICSTRSCSAVQKAVAAAIPAPATGDLDRTRIATDRPMLMNKSADNCHCRAYANPAGSRPTNAMRLAKALALCHPSTLAIGPESRRLQSNGRIRR